MKYNIILAISFLLYSNSSYSMEAKIDTAIKTLTEKREKFSETINSLNKKINSNEQEKFNLEQNGSPTPANNRRIKVLNDEVNLFRVQKDEYQKTLRLIDENLDNLNKSNPNQRGHDINKEIQNPKSELPAQPPEVSKQGVNPNSVESTDPKLNELHNRLNELNNQFEKIHLNPDLERTYDDMVGKLGPQHKNRSDFEGLEGDVRKLSRQHDIAFQKLEQQVNSLNTNHDGNQGHSTASSVGNSNLDSLKAEAKDPQWLRETK